MFFSTRAGSALSSAGVRASFIDYFRQHGHVHVPSSSVVPDNDNSLLFVSAGMNQFKPILLGQTAPQNDCKRVVNSQKCIRAGGKHNDLDDVGKDNYHHTFFEMLGNWSFGDYYKKEACEFAWRYLVETLGIAESRLYVTYFGGDSRLGLPADRECAEIWQSIGVPTDRVIPSGSKDNFWEMAEIGPCGPCSEIHIDKVEGRTSSVAHLVNQDHPEVVELWNLVFMAYNRIHGGQIEPLARPNIDCGMGFERLVSVLQNVDSNYDTDVFQPILRQISELSRVGAYSGKLGPEDANGKDAAYRIIADHMRAVSVALADGVKLSGVSRGFVVRKMLRRAALASTETLGIDRLSLSSVAEVVIRELGGAYPELLRNQNDILRTVRMEEEKFFKLIDNGKKMFAKYVRKIPRGSTVFPGEFAFELHESHGFTIDLTQKFAEQHGFAVDMADFHERSTAARQLSQSQSKMRSAKAVS